MLPPDSLFKSSSTAETGQLCRGQGAGSPLTNKGEPSCCAFQGLDLEDLCYLCFQEIKADRINYVAVSLQILTEQQVNHLRKALFQNNNL